MTLRESAPATDSVDCPLFTIEHALSIPATPEEVWAVLLDFAKYPDWNPYVLAISGDLTEGAELTITIAQANWPKPVTLNPTLIRADPLRVLHWRGRVGEGGVLDTDHSFQIDATADDATDDSAGRCVRFSQREEFRGSLAERLEGDAKQFTHQAFRAMNEALSQRVQALKSAGA